MADVETHYLGVFLASFESHYIGVKEIIHRSKSMWYNNLDHMIETDGADPTNEKNSS